MLGATLVWLAVRCLLVLAAQSESQEEDINRPRLGGAINLLSRYGYLSISMKVIPRNETNTSWLYREPTIDVFKDITPYKLTYMTDETNPRDTFKGDFHMEFCDNLRQLLQAYFRDFTFEMLEQPWRAFSGSWSKSGMAKHLGINPNFINGNYCYVLVRVSRYRIVGRMDPVEDNINLDEDALQGAENVVLGDEATVYSFLRNYGSHYLVSYTTGNSLYQVFVFSAPIYLRVKERLRSKGVSQISNNELSGYFSPWYAEHIGEIQSASGNHTTKDWAASNLRVHFYFFSYPSLLKLHGNVALLNKLNDILGNEAILAMDMRTLAPAFKDPKKRAWFLEVIDNYLKLWETNM